MTQLATPEKSISQASTRSQRPTALQLSRVLPFLIAGLLLILAYIAFPSALYTYNISRASRALDAGITWPSPRTADSFPAVRDNNALDRSLGHLAAATRWRPRDSYGRRLASRVYAARGEWVRAAAELEQARKLAPRNPLIAWEAALVYEQLWQGVHDAPRENIMADLASMPIHAPPEPIDTVYCRNGQASTCYVDIDQYTQSYAALPDGPEVTTDVLFMHPPASVKLTRIIPAEAPALAFLMGLDPGVRTWKTDGATFEIWLTPQQGSPVLVFQHNLDAAVAKQGWVPGAANLAAWAGQRVTLELRTSGGPAGNTVDDWYAWGNVTFTGPEAAQHAIELPEIRMRQAWQAAGVSGGQFTALGDVALEESAFESALAWYTRAKMIDPNIPGIDFRRELASVGAQKGRAQHSTAQLEVTPLLANGTRIEPAGLRWVRAEPWWNVSTGDQLLKANSQLPDIGIMNWTGSAVAIIDVAEAGTYQITVRAQHTAPAPIQLQLEHNLSPIKQFELKRGDHSWEEIQANVVLNPGLQMVGVRFLNDAVVDNIDRNAVLDWIEIRRQ